ncbi:MAG: helix-hairpin-helix domain-containing protein [Anaerolineae bacterium]
MKGKNSTHFLIGLLFGAMVCVVVWYWQKSTSAEDGALALLDRVAAAEARIRNLRAELAQARAGRRAEAEPAEVKSVAGDDLQQVRGIGPVFETRLRQAGIETIANLAGLTAAHLAEILDVSAGRAEAILDQARTAVA